MESNKKNIAFKIPDNPQMGLGHFIRCFKIAKKIQIIIIYFLLQA